MISVFQSLGKIVWQDGDKRIEINPGLTAYDALHELALALNPPPAEESVVEAPKKASAR